MNVDGLRPSRRERPADTRRPCKGPHGRAGAPALRRCGPRLRGHRAVAPRAVRERAGRPAARSAQRHPRVRPGRRRSRRASPARTSSQRRRRRGHARRARLRPLHARGGSSRGCAAERRIEELAGLRVATAYPVSTRRLLGERGVEVELVPVSGSVEATPRLGLADAIVDLVSTGSTASANGLRRIGSLLASQAVLVGGREASSRNADLVDRLVLMVSGVVAARRRRYVMMNARPRRARGDPAVLPSMGAPSVLPLASEGQIAVHAAVEADDVWTLLPALKQAGASSILVLPVERVDRMRGAGARGRAPGRGGDRRRRAIARRRRAARLGRAVGRRQPVVAARVAGDRLAAARVEPDELDALRALAACGGGVRRVQRPADTALEPVPRRARRTAVAAARLASASTSPRGGFRCRRRC